MGAELLSGHYKSGGIEYIAEDNSIRAAFRLNSTTRKILGFGVPCRAVDKVRAELKPLCGSFVDPDRPGWYLTRRGGVPYYEPEYDPTNPDTFDEDASSIAKVDNFFPGFVAFESLSLPNWRTRRYGFTSG